MQYDLRCLASGCAPRVRRLRCSEGRPAIEDPLHRSILPGCSIASSRRCRSGERGRSADSRTINFRSRKIAAARRLRARMACTAEENCDPVRRRLPYSATSSQHARAKAQQTACCVTWLRSAGKEVDTHISMAGRTEEMRPRASRPRTVWRKENPVLPDPGNA